MKRCLCLLLVLILTPLASLAQGAPPEGWPDVPASKGSDAFNHAEWAQTTQDCEVFEGPGDAYAQDGRYGALEAGRWVRVFGREGTWALILYSPAQDVYRFGYCPVSALPDGDNVEPLPEWGGQYGVSGCGWITDDPLSTRDETFLPNECPVQYLCALGDDWLYVQLTQLDGSPRRGFILVRSLMERALFAQSPVSAPTPTPAAVTAAAYAPTPEPSPTMVPSAGLSQQTAVTLAENVLWERFGFTREQTDALNVNTMMWAGENFPVCWLIEFYRGDYTTETHVVSVGVDANTGDLRGCYLHLDGVWTWLEADALDALDAETVAEAFAPTPTATASEHVIRPDATPTLAGAAASPAATPDPDTVALMEQFVEQTFVPMAAAEADDPSFTRAQRRQVLVMAMDTGLSFTGDWRTAILGDYEEEPKSQLLANLVNSQLTYAGPWPVAEMHWYGEIQVRCGFWEENPYLLPEAGEYTQEEALAYARQALTEKKGVSDNWLSGCDIWYSFQCLDGDVGDGTAGSEAGNRTWWFSFYPVGEPESDSYYVFFSATGGGLRIVTK